MVISVGLMIFREMVSTSVFYIIICGDFISAQFIKFNHEKGTVSFQSLIKSEYWIGVDYDTLELVCNY